MSALLIAQDLVIQRGDRVLLEGFSLQLAAGELLHLRGPNGAGKSSLLESLAGLRRSEGGTVQRLGPLHWLGHRNALNLSLSPLENLNFWAGLQGLAPAPGLLTAALQRLGLRRQRHLACAGLSAGQRRRAALARLVIEARPLWLLDEPLSGLDAEGLGLFGALLDEQLQSGGAVLLTSHQSLPGSSGRRREWSLPA